jgi:hypothetical protein
MINGDSGTSGTAWPVSLKGDGMRHWGTSQVIFYCTTQSQSIWQFFWVPLRGRLWNSLPRPPLTPPAPPTQTTPTLAGEAGFALGAEGATAPETLRQKDRAG